MADCSLIIVTPDDRKRVGENHQYITQIAELAGVKLIKLQLHRSPRNSPHSLRGYQCAYVTMGQDRITGQPKYVVSYSMDERDPMRMEACDGNRPLVFEEDSINGQLYGYVPDTEFNRKRLLATFMDGADWEIVDKELSAELEKEYRLTAKAEAEDKSKDALIAAHAEKSVQLDADLLAEREENRRLRETLRQLQKSGAKPENKRPSLETGEIGDDNLKSTGNANRV